MLAGIVVGTYLRAQICIRQSLSSDASEVKLFFPGRILALSLMLESAGRAEEQLIDPLI